ncbi:unsaturated rhamnogalacturonyl hydrolase [Paenibacillus aceris]|uniref:Unsaturated rhamnogalacturonyl hydrolase n=1 Tax=Paenibacillus aceris TaxID=869555 RepID=A0ABS4I9X3_9BACL|nr:unsaturated rhamnogalacturonyl hydrolase [Paenibacillus aceris]
MSEALDKQPLTVQDPPLVWAAHACDTIMRRYSPEELPPAGRWHYHQGVFLQAMEKVWLLNSNSAYFDYIKAYVDLMVGPNGELEVQDHLDDLMSGQLLLLLDAETDDAHYRKLSSRLMNMLKSWRTTSDGGFWHKDVYPNQMWLDGIYMEGPFAVKYAIQYGEPEWFDLIVEQALLIEKHMKDEATGLLFHAWDESGVAKWAHPETKRSPDFWGRSVGWYAMALAEILELLPDTHPQRAKLIVILRDLLAAVRQFQEDREGLWYQVLDKGDRPDNWLELSCSTLFVFAMAKAVKHGWVPVEGFL